MLSTSESEKISGLTIVENSEFMSKSLGGVLASAVDWISTNKEPDDVFTQARLEQWARDNGFKDGGGE